MVFSRRRRPFVEYHIFLFNETPITLENSFDYNSVDQFIGSSFLKPQGEKTNKVGYSGAFASDLFSSYSRKGRKSREASLEIL
jgi:hypothetical protein